MKVKLFTDGGSRGNPGPAAYGFVLKAEDGTVLFASGERIGIHTNNYAEYSALIAGLMKAIQLDAQEVEVMADSKLLVMQMSGEWKVKNETLHDLFVQATRLSRELDNVTYTWIPREENEHADRLVNEALDAE